MGFFKKIWQFIIAFICAPTKPAGTRAAEHNRHTTSTDVRIILCLSPNIPHALWGEFKPKDYVGVISSEYPRKCMIPERAATFISACMPAELPELVSLPGFEQTFFYPFRELAYALGYDVLWCTYKEHDSKNYTGHVLFAEHIGAGVWIRIGKELYENLFGTTYPDQLYTGGWLYAVPDPRGSFYYVQATERRTLVYTDDILELIDTN